MPVLSIEDFLADLNPIIEDPAVLTSVLAVSLGVILLGVLLFLYPFGSDN